jgi:hypothetical protein
MSAVSVNPPFPIFTDTDGQPLENGYIWIGTVNLDPQGNPITVYWDSALTQVAGQPIRTSGGYPVRNGSPARIYTGSDYSIRVQNKNGSTVYSASAATEFMSAADVSFQPAGAGATARTVQSKLRDTVSVKDFGAVGDGVADDTAAIQAAISGSSGRSIYFPKGTYCVTGISYTFLQNQHWFGDGPRSSILKYVGADGGDLAFLSGYAYSSIRHIGFDGNNLARHGLKIYDDTGAVAGVSIDNVLEDIIVYNCTKTNGYALAFDALTAWQVSDIVVRDFATENCYNGIFLDKPQTIRIAFENVTLRAMTGGVGVTLNGTQTNFFYNIHITGTTSIDWLIKSTADGSSFYLDGYYRETTQPVFKFENGATGHVGYFDIRNVNILWSGTNAATKIIQQQFGTVIYENFWLRTFTGSSAGELDFTHSNEGAGSRCFVDQSGFFITGPGAANISTTYSGSYYYEMREPGKLKLSNRDNLSTGVKAITLERPSAFGSFRENGIAFSTAGTKDGYIASAAGLTGTVAQCLADQTELMQYGGTASAGVVRRVGASGVNGFQQPFYLGSHALWVDSTGDLRIKNGAPTSDLDGVVVGTQT